MQEKVSEGMDRDPTNYECTRDPIFLLQIGVRKWTQIPDGVGCDGDGMWVEDRDELPDWIVQFVDEEDQTIDASAEFYAVAEKQENDHGWPMIYVEWRTESVFLTREEGESYAKSRGHRWDKWQVYCVPCDGELARILREYQPAS